MHVRGFLGASSGLQGPQGASSLSRGLEGPSGLSGPVAHIVLVLPKPRTLGEAEISWSARKSKDLNALSWMPRRIRFQGPNTILFMCIWALEPCFLGPGTLRKP